MTEGAETRRRRQRHSLVANRLAGLSDRELGDTLAGARQLGSGIGGVRCAIDVEGVPVFAKRIPLTAIERQPGNVGSTRNLFDMPTHCQYGVGSPGFGVWRELAANQITTEWVLDGELSCFPVNYHWRVLEGAPSDDPLFHELEDIDGFVDYWHGSAGMRRRVEAIAAATAHVALFLEYVPTTIGEWLGAQLAEGESATDSAIDVVEAAILEDLVAMNRRGLFHFDAHFANLLTDGEQIFFADLGLAVSPSFKLSESEEAFLAANESHDVCFALTLLVNWLVINHLGVADQGSRDNLIGRVASDASTATRGTRSAARVIARYAPIAVIINEFYNELLTSSRSAIYPTRAAEEACAQAGLAVSARRS